MQRLFNIDKWSKLAQGHVLEFPGEAPRRIRLEVNAPLKVPLYYVDGDGVPTFLALVEGRDTLEFHTTGTCGISADGDCYVFTADGDDVSSVVEAPVIFTKIMERRPRNYEMERMQYEMRANQRRLMEAQSEQLERLIAGRVATLEAELAAARVSRGTGSESESDGDTGRPAEPTT